MKLLNAKPITPEYAKQIKKIPRSVSASILGISPNYLNCILGGHSRPSKKLDFRLKELANQITAEERGVTA